MSLVVIGVGNRWRRDDGAGLEVARRLEPPAARGVRVIAHEGDGAGLLVAWAGADEAVVVDAASSGAAPGRVHRFDANAGPLPARLLRSSTHAFGVPEAIELGRALGRLPAGLHVYGIEGGDFTAGEGLTAEVEAAVDAVVRELSGHAPARRPRGDVGDFLGHTPS